MQHIETAQDRRHLLESGDNYDDNTTSRTTILNPKQPPKPCRGGLTPQANSGWANSNRPQTLRKLAQTLCKLGHAG